MGSSSVAPIIIVIAVVLVVVFNLLVNIVLNRLIPSSSRGV